VPSHWNRFRERRQLLKTAGFIGLGLAGIIPSGCGPAKDAATIGAQEHPPARDLYPTRHDTRFVLDRPPTEEVYAASYNNFYEFSVFKGSVYKKAARLRTSPWQVEVSGLVEKPRVFEVDELIRMMTLEERLYRFRCVEAWGCRGPVFRCGNSLRRSNRSRQPSISAS
jgi:sulfoxide reductase catalytic subunit YedY